jgi:cytochrome c556
MSSIARFMALAVCAVGIGLVSVGSGWAADEPANLIKYRKNVMKSIGAHITNIAAVVKGEVSRTDHLTRDAAALAELTRDIPTLFPEGSGDGDTRALPDIWADWAKFEEAAKTTHERAQELAAVAEGGDVAAVGPALGALGKACGGCHKPFRKEQ